MLFLVKRYLPISLLAIGTFAMGIDSFVLSGILPQINQNFAVTSDMSGQLITVFALTYAICAPIASIFTSHYSRSTVIKVALGLFIVANILSVLSATFSHLLLTRVLAGIGASLFTPNASAAALQLTDARRRGKALAIVLGGLTLGVVFGVPIGTYIGQTISWRATLVVVSITGLIALVGVHFFLPHLAPAPQVSLRDRLRVLANKKILVIILFMLLSSAASISTYTFLAGILNTTAQITGTSLSLALLFWGIGGAVGSFSSGYATDRFGSSWTLAAATLLLIATLCLLPYAQNFAWVAPILFLNGLGSWAIATPNNHRLTALVADLPAVVISYNSAGIYLGQAVGTAIAAYTVADQVSYAQIPLISLVMALLSLVLLVVSIKYPVRARNI